MRYLPLGKRPDRSGNRHTSAQHSTMVHGVQCVLPADVAAATGGFHTVAEIGEGGFGKVYRAMVNHRPVACKVRQWRD